MRLIDADLLEKAGWTLNRTVSTSDTITFETKSISEVPTVRCDCALPIQGDIVKNCNNNTYGIVIDLVRDKNAVQILEYSVLGKRLFVNCPPLTAIENTGKHLNFSQLIMEQVEK